MKSYQKNCYENKNWRVHEVSGYAAGKAYAQHLHYDTDYTLAYFRKGSGTIKIEGTSYDISDGDVFLLHHNEIHFVSLAEDVYAERITVYTNESLFSRFSCNPEDFFCVFSKGKHNKIPAKTITKYGIGTLFDEILRYSKKKDEKNDVLCSCKLIELLEKLYELSEDKDMPSKENSFVSDVVSYINEHYTEILSIDEIAKEFFLSKYHLSRIFKTNVGLSLWDYVITKRLSYFNDLMRNGKTVKDACFSSGFQNYSNFYRLYKKHFGITPNEFKNQLHTKSLVTET